MADIIIPAPAISYFWSVECVFLSCSTIRRDPDGQYSCIMHKVPTTDESFPSTSAPDGRNLTTVSAVNSRQIAISAMLFILGTILGVFLASLPFRTRAPLGGSFPAGFLNLVGIGSLTFYACLLSSPLYVWLARRVPIFGQHWRKNLVIHFLVTTALVLLSSVIFFQLMVGKSSSTPARPERTGSGSLPAGQASNENTTAEQSRRPAANEVRRPNIANFLLIRFFTESLPFWALIALVHALEFHRRYRQREIETARLQTQLAESRLEALTAQLQPHFLFNTLQGISTLMHRDVKAADAMLSRLSDLLRLSLQRGEKQLAPISEEVEMLAHYVEISRERFKDRLVFETQISANARQALVPFFILQPLVENALQHGIARRAGIGRVSVCAEHRGEMLHVSVSDDGPGLPNTGREFPREGIGLSNTRQRLRELYGDRHRLTLTSRDEGGLRVELSIPYSIATTSEEGTS